MSRENNRHENTLQYAAKYDGAEYDKLFTATPEQITEAREALKDAPSGTKYSGKPKPGTTAERTNSFVKLGDAIYQIAHAVCVNPSNRKTHEKEQNPSLTGIIDTGAYADVKLARNIDTGKNIALRITTITSNNAIKKPHHANLTETLGLAIKNAYGTRPSSTKKRTGDGKKPLPEETHKAYQALEIKGESLFSYLRAHKKTISLEKKLLIATRMSLALQNLHDMDIAHLDVKPNNFLINPSTLDISIIDFESTRKGKEALIDYTLDPRGTSGYMPFPDDLYDNYNKDEPGNTAEYKKYSRKQLDLFALTRCLAPPTSDQTKFFGGGIFKSFLIIINASIFGDPDNKDAVTRYSDAISPPPQHAIAKTMLRSAAEIGLKLIAAHYGLEERFFIRKAEKEQTTMLEKIETILADPRYSQNEQTRKALILDVLNPPISDQMLVDRLTLAQAAISAHWNTHSATCPNNLENWLFKTGGILQNKRLPPAEKVDACTAMLAELEILGEASTKADNPPKNRSDWLALFKNAFETHECNLQDLSTNRVTAADLAQLCATKTDEALSAAMTQKYQHADISLMPTFKNILKPYQLRNNSNAPANNPLVIAIPHSIDNQTEQNYLMEELKGTAERNKSCDIIFTGHGETGRLMEKAVQAILLEEPSAQVRAISFGSPGLTPPTASEGKLTPETRAHFIAFAHNNDSHAQQTGPGPAGFAYTLGKGTGHSAQAYADTLVTSKDKRLQHLGTLSLTQNLQRDEVNRFVLEVKRLQTNDTSYAGKNKKTPKLWVAEKLLAIGMTGDTNNPIVKNFTSLVREVSGMKRTWFQFSPTSARLIPKVTKSNDGKITNKIPITVLVEAEVDRLARTEKEYQPKNKKNEETYESLKLTLFRALLAELKDEKAAIWQNVDTLQETLDALYHLKRGSEKAALIERVDEKVATATPAPVPNTSPGVPISLVSVAEAEKAPASASSPTTSANELSPGHSNITSPSDTPRNEGAQTPVKNPAGNPFAFFFKEQKDFKEQKNDDPTTAHRL